MTVVDTLHLLSCQVKAMVEKVGILCSLTLPLQGSSTAGSVEFDPPLDDLPVRPQHLHCLNHPEQ